MEKIDERSSNFRISGGLSNPFFITTKADKIVEPSPLNKEGRISSGIRNSSDVKKRCLSDGGEISESVLRSNIFGREKRLRLQASDKSEKAEPKYSLHSFQNGGSLTFKGASSERRFFMHTRSIGCIFFSCTSQNFLEISKIFMAGKSLRVLLLCFGLEPALRIFTKLMKILIALEAFEFLVDNLPERHLTYGKLTRGNHDGEEDIDFSITESRFCNKLSKICFESFSPDSI